MYDLIRWIINVLMHIGARVHIEGAENAPANGPLLVVVNHLSRMDPPLIMISVQRRMRVFAARKYHSNPFFFLLFSVVGVIWVRQNEADREALRMAVDHLHAGGVLGMAPEGTRSQETHGMIRALDGGAFVATRSGVTILPVAVWGTEKMIPALLRLRRANIFARVGQPFQLKASARARGPDLEAATDEIMRSISVMLPPEYRGEYGEGNS